MFLHRNVQSFSGYPKVLPHQPNKCSTFSTSWVFSRVSSWWDYLPRWIIEPPLPAFLNVEEQWFFSKLLLGYQTSSPICKGVHLARNTHFSCWFSGSYPTWSLGPKSNGRKKGWPVNGNFVFYLSSFFTTTDQYREYITGTAAPNHPPTILFTLTKKTPRYLIPSWNTRDVAGNTSLNGHNALTIYKSHIKK